jgi:hypothetical protein
MTMTPEETKKFQEAEAELEKYNQDQTLGHREYWAAIKAAVAAEEADTAKALDTVERDFPLSNSGGN